MERVDERKTEGEAKEKVSFSPEQQAKVQELIDSAFKRAYAKAGKSGGEEMDRLRHEVDSLREERKRALLYREISRYNVVDADEVAKLVEDRVRIGDDGRAVVLGNSGAPEVSRTGSPVGVEDFLAEWFLERPHHLKAPSRAGAGSRLDAGGGLSRRNWDASDPLSWREMPREELDRRLREGFDIRGAAGQVYRFRDVRNPFLDARRRRFNAPGRGKESKG